MRIFARIGLVVVLVLLGVGHALAQTVTLSGDLLADWQQQKRTMMAIAEAMPDEAFGFKPTEAQRTYAEQILQHRWCKRLSHGTPGRRGGGAGGRHDDFAVFGLPATSKTVVLEALAAGYDYGIAVLQEFSDDELLETIAGPQYLGNVTRVKMAYFTLSHAMDIYGQMVVYLRLNGVTPPASRRGV